MIDVVFYLFELKTNDKKKFRAFTCFYLIWLGFENEINPVGIKQKL